MLLLFLVSLAQAGRVDHKPFIALWDDVTSKLGSSNEGLGYFPNAAEIFKSSTKSFRYNSVFLPNNKRIRSAPKIAYKMKANFFALLRHEEWSAYLSHANMTSAQLWTILQMGDTMPHHMPNELPLTNTAQLNTDIKVRHSGAGDSGALMTAVTMLEYLYLKVTDKSVSLSPQYFLNCVKESSDKVPIMPVEVWDHVVGNGILPVEDKGKVMWENKKEDCVDPAKTVDKPIKISGSKFALINENELLILNIHYGAIAVCIYVDLTVDDKHWPKFLFYSSGIFTDFISTDKGTCNHFVILIGYTQETIILQNSWGPDWGASGRIQITRNHILKINGQPSTFRYYVMAYTIMKIADRIIGDRRIVNSATTYDIMTTKTSPLNFKDYVIPDKTELGDIFLIKVSAAINDNIYVGLLSSDHVTITYQLVIQLINNRVIQRSTVPNQDPLTIRQKLTTEMKENSGDIMNIRIKMKDTYIETVINDEPLKTYNHQAHFEDITYIEASNASVITHLRKGDSVVSQGFLDFKPNSAAESCSNRDLDEVCEEWTEIDYCQDFSKYKRYLADWCEKTCGFCTW